MPDYVLLFAILSTITSTVVSTATVLGIAAVRWHKDNLQFRLARTALKGVEEAEHREKVLTGLAKVFAKWKSGRTPSNRSD